MKCYQHPDSDFVAVCTSCGKGLCAECASKYEIPACDECLQAYNQTIKTGYIKQFVLSGILLILGIVIALIASQGVGTALLTGYLIAGIPAGWSILTKITPKVFLFLPIIGWVIYFLIKFVLSVAVGVIALPVRIVKGILEIRKINQTKTLATSL